MKKMPNSFIFIFFVELDLSMLQTVQKLYKFLSFTCCMKTQILIPILNFLSLYHDIFIQKERFGNQAIFELT